MSIKYVDVDLVMGWDVGDGDTVAYARNAKDLSQEMFPLYIHKSRSEQVVKSAVSKQSNGGILIGSDAATQQNFQINFKRSPGTWDNKSEQNVKYRQHMSDFIRGVSEAILSNSANRTKLNSAITINKNVAQWRSDKVLLVVGCPAAKIWKGKENRREYEDLISKATGIKNVIVVEESRAAIFSLFALNDLLKKINLQKGVLVLDFGSSTADATCIIPGDKAIHLSWELGAAQIEWAMLRYILDSAKTRKELDKQAKANDRRQALIDESDCNHAVFQLRGDKEDYFDGKRDGNTLSDQIRLSMIDENGDIIVDDGEPVTVSIPYKITSEMMDYALREYRFDVRKDNIVVSTGTWEKNCKNFLGAVKLLLEKNKLSLRSVVVTGGGSSMPFVVALAKSVFGDSNVIPSDTPSHSVVRGLTTIAYNALVEEDARKKAVESVVKDGRGRVNATLSNIAQKLAEQAYDDAVAALDNSACYMEDGAIGRFFEGMFDWGQTVGDIANKIQWALNNSLERNNSEIIKSELNTWDKTDKEMIVAAINQAVTEMYSDKAIQEMVKVGTADVDDIRKNLHLPNISIPNIGEDANILGKILTTVLTMVLFVVLSIIAAAVPGIGTIFVGVVGTIGWGVLQEWLVSNKNFPVPLASVKRAVKKMKSERSSELYKIKRSIYDELEKAFTAESAYGKDFHKHYTVLKETTNQAFDRILLIAADGE